MTELNDTDYPEVPDTAAPHPEEMTATMEIKAGERFSWKATARTTPAGLVSAALFVSAVLIPILWLKRRT
jgi:hypothetical protein